MDRAAANQSQVKVTERRWPLLPWVLMKGRCLLVLLGAALAVVAMPGTALGARDHLACKLTHPKLVKAVFELPHVVYTSTANSPTAPPPANYAPDGADQSVCDVNAWSNPPSSPNAFGVVPPHWEIPACCGSVAVSTRVQDEGPEGVHYSVEQQYDQLRKAVESFATAFTGGGTSLSDHLFGASRATAYWWGSKEHLAGAFWQVNGGIVVIEVHAHTHPRPKLWDLAHHIVPAFAPYG